MSIDQDRAFECGAAIKTATTQLAKNGYKPLEVLDGLKFNLVAAITAINSRYSRIDDDDQITEMIIGINEEMDELLKRHIRK